jgi:hypothetical protein
MAGGVEIDTDYGPVGSGSCNARYVLAENGNEYLAKGPNLSPSLRHVGANEMVAGRLAGQMGLPVLDIQVLSDNDRPLIGITRMNSDRMHPIMDQELFAACNNQHRVYGMVVFDVWLCNTDRHEGNLIARCGGTETQGKKRLVCGWDRHHMVLTDHSHCLLPDNVEPTHFSSLMSRDRLGEFVLLPFVREAIRSRDMLRQALTKAEEISDEVLGGIVSQVPVGLLAADDRTEWAEFLIGRRDRLRELFGSGRESFPHLEAGDI